MIICTRNIAAHACDESVSCCTHTSEVVFIMAENTSLELAELINASAISFVTLLGRRKLKSGESPKTYTHVFIDRELGHDKMEREN